MASTHRRYSKEEFARRGDAIYARSVQPQLTKADEGRFVAIDIETESFEIADDEFEAGDHLRKRVPGAQIWIVRVGSHAVHRFGGQIRRASS